jgi:hypothetical protein
MSYVIEVPLTRIETDPELQPRAMMNAVTIEEYREAIEHGEKLPPVIVFDDGENFWLADGFHRYEATAQAAIAKIEAEVREGSKRDAILYSVQANATHGLRRSPADKRKAVITLLQDPEWTKWSDREIARKTRTSHTFVAKVRQQTGNVASERTYEDRHGNVTTMETSGIADANRERAAGQGPSTDWTPALSPHEDRSKPAEEQEIASGPTTQVPAGERDEEAREESAWAPDLKKRDKLEIPAPAPRKKPDLPPPSEQIKPRTGVLTVRIGDGDEMEKRSIMVALGDEGKGPSVFFRGVLADLPDLTEKALVRFYGDKAASIFENGAEEEALPAGDAAAPELPFEPGDVVTWQYGSVPAYGRVESFSGSYARAYVRTTQGQRQIVDVEKLEKAEPEEV